MQGIGASRQFSYYDNIPKALRWRTNVERPRLIMTIPLEVRKKIVGGDQHLRMEVQHPIGIRFGRPVLGEFLRLLRRQETEEEERDNKADQKAPRRNRVAFRNGSNYRFYNRLLQGIIVTH